MLANHICSVFNSKLKPSLRISEWQESGSLNSIQHENPTLGDVPLYIYATKKPDSAVSAVQQSDSFTTLALALAHFFILVASSLFLLAG